jgi:DNA (cytosine-5)-methyltransferase 1
MLRLNIADLFCGAGGTSAGALEAAEQAGYRVNLKAFNHWDVAISSHTANHPDAEHFCCNLDNVNPQAHFKRDGLDILWASPECQKHSHANRKRASSSPENERSRATAWKVADWADDLRPKSILVENVPPFANWRSFQAWFDAILSMGYRGDAQLLCAADFGDPTTRERLFVQFVRGRRQIVWPNPTHSQEADIFGLKPWVPAADIIDWTLPMRSIFGRKRPLAENTLRRISEGLDDSGSPILIHMEHGGRIVPISRPMPVITTAKGGAFGLAYVLPQHGGGLLRSCKVPAPTVAASGAISLIVEYYGTGKARPVTKPLPTVTCRDRFALIRQQGGDVLFRMLKPHELALAQGFRRGYQFHGTQSDQTKQIGNAVPRRLARAIVAANITQNSDVSWLRDPEEKAA